jgi:hypothetical protein
MLWDSSLNPPCKLGLIKTFVIRIHRLCSTKKVIEDALNHLRKSLLSHGYQPHIIQRGIDEGGIIVRHLSRMKQPPTFNTPERTLFFTMSYDRDESLVFTAKLKKVFKQLLPLVKIYFAFRKHRTL